jgi:hypothetical protein
VVLAGLAACVNQDLLENLHSVDVSTLIFPIGAALVKGDAELGLGAMQG